MNGKSVTCGNVEPLLAAMIDGEVTRSERATIDAHLDGCAECAEAVDRVREATLVLDDVPDPLHVKQLPRGRSEGDSRKIVARGRPSPLVWAGSVLAAAALAAAATYAFQGPSDDELRVTGARVEDHGARARDGRGRERVEQSMGGPDAERLADAERRIHDLEARIADCNSPAASAEAPRPANPPTSASPEAVVKKAAPAIDSTFGLPIGPPPATTTTAATPADTSPAGPGFLTVVCMPFCRDVIVDGKSHGPSPIVKIALTPGKHLTQLIRDDANQRHMIVDIRSGETARVHAKFDAPSAPNGDDPLSGRK